MWVGADLHQLHCAKLFVRAVLDVYTRNAPDGVLGKSSFPWSYTDTAAVRSHGIRPWHPRAMHPTPFGL